MTDFPTTTDTTPALFSMVPAGLFGPLASANREHYWQLLCRLFEEFFGPDAPMPPSIGFPRREITAAIERYLLTDDPWEDEDGRRAGCPVDDRANAIYERFRAAGWLRQERIGAREMASHDADGGATAVRPDRVQRARPDLRLGQGAFDRAAVAAGGRGQGRRRTLDEAADQARRLLSSLASMSLQVRDLMPELSSAETTAQFARQWFERYVGELFIGDYAELHKADHPLARRSSILAMVRTSNSAAARIAARLVPRTPDRRRSVRAELRLQRSLRRLYELERIDEYLGRLDDDIRQANRRALAFLDYRLRAPDKLDVLLQRACRGAQAAPEEALRLPVAPGRCSTNSGCVRRGRASSRSHARPTGRRHPRRNSWPA